jgi:hypothetical protein
LLVANEHAYMLICTYQPYNDMAKKDKERYEGEKSAYDSVRTIPCSRSLF